MQLLLVRHGEPLPADAETGAADPALSERGVEEAQAFARWVRRSAERDAIAEVVVSTMRRARETAAPSAEVLGLTPTVVGDLVEFDEGRSSYRPVHLRADDDPDWRAIRSGHLPSYVDRDAFVQRVHRAFAAITARHTGRANVLVVCHAGVINTYLTTLLGIEPPLYFPLHHVSVSRVLVSGSGTRRVRSINETGPMEPR